MIGCCNGVKRHGVGQKQGPVAELSSVFVIRQRSQKVSVFATFTLRSTPELSVYFTSTPTSVCSGVPQYTLARPLIEPDLLIARLEQSTDVFITINFGCDFFFD